MTVKLIAQVLVSPVTLLSQLVSSLLERTGQSMELRGQPADGIRSTLFLDGQASGHVVHFFPDVLFQRGESLLEVVP